MSSIWTLRRASLSAGLGCIVGALLACDVQGKSPRATLAPAPGLPAAARSTPAPAEPPALAPPPPELAEGTPVEREVEEQHARLAAPHSAWQFQTAAPISGAPAVTDEGSVYVTSVDGFVHALTPTGQFRWSRGLTGVPMGAPANDRAGHIYVATSARRIYAVHSDGSLKWMYPTTTRVATAPIWADSGSLYFAGRDRQVYALASWGGPLWNRSVERVVTVAPAVVDGALVVGSGQAQLSFFRGSSGGGHLELPGELTQPVLSSRERLLVVAGGQLVAFDLEDRSVAWRRDARYAGLSEDGEWLIAESGRELIWLEPSTGAELHRVALPDDGSDVPVLSNAGVAMVPLVSGDLVVAAPSSVVGVDVAGGGGPFARVTLATAPLWRPVWNERTQLVVAASGNGTVSAVDLTGWHTALAPDADGDTSPELRSGASRDEAEPHAPEVEARAMGSAGGGA
jgi:hypothetical protein